MKKIEAIIRMSKFEEVKKALAEINVKFFTLHEVRGYGLQKGEKMIYRGSEFGTEYIERVQMDIAKQLGERDLLLRRDILVAQENDEVIEPGLVEFAKSLVVQVFEINTFNLCSQCSRHRLHCNALILSH